jgi:hypothetical protein
MGLATAACLVASTVVDDRTGLWQRLGFVIGDAWLIGSALGLLRSGQEDRPQPAT